MNSFSSLADIEIWNMFKAGDDKAYEYIYHRYSAELFSYGYHIINDKQLVEDSAHDLFVYLFQHRATLGDTNAIKYYLFKSLRRRIMDALEQQSKGYAQRDAMARTMVQTSLSPEKLIMEEETAFYINKKLMVAIDDLPARQREAIFLLYFSNLSYPEIAEVMSLSIRTVYNQVHTAIQTLRKLFAQSKSLPAFLE
jgi:RNA polymerase sigma-70 factor (ECF subfamily)